MTMSPESITPEDLLVLNVPHPVPYEEQRAETLASQQGKSRAEIAQELAESSESTFDPETATKPKHVWKDRGVYMSCEGAGHPTHRHAKVGGHKPAERTPYVSRWLKK
jgi:hypothetical protein